MSNEMFPQMGLLGVELQRDIYNGLGVLILPKSTVLTEDHLLILHNHQTTLFDRDVIYPETPTVSANKSQQLMDSVVEEIKDIFDDIRQTGTIPITNIRAQITPLVHHTTDHPDFANLLASIHAKDDYTYRHNIGVGVISTLIGKWLGYGEEDLLELTLAAALHDVGKMKIPSEILNKPGKLTDAEYDLMKKHTIFGYEMLQKTADATERQALVALQHHERGAGNGYPYGIGKDQMDPMSKIVAVADVFHAMTSTRVYRKAWSFFETLKMMEKGAFGEFEPQVIRVFIDKVMQSTVGSHVLLNDGRKGQVVHINPNNPIYPLIRFEKGFLDLSRDQTVFITQLCVV